MYLRKNILEILAFFKPVIGGVKCSYFRFFLFSYWPRVKMSLSPTVSSQLKSETYTAEGKVRESESEWVNTLILMCGCVLLLVCGRWVVFCCVTLYCGVVLFIRYLVSLAILENLAFLENFLSFLRSNLSFLIGRAGREVVSYLSFFSKIFELKS